MIKRLLSKKGDASAIPMILMIVVSIVPVIVIFLLVLDNNIVSMQKSRYAKAVDMAVNTAVANIELSEEKDAYNHTLTEQQIAMGVGLEESSIDYIALGYSVDKRLVVNKESLMDVFYQVLLKNFQVKGIEGNVYIDDDRKIYGSNTITKIQRYIPLKAILQYDTISLSSGYHFDSDKKRYLDDWQDVRLHFSAKNPYTLAYDDIYLTLGDQCYTVDKTKTIDERFKEENKNYFTAIDGTENIYGINESQKNKELARAVKNALQAYANQNKNADGSYKINIGEFDSHKFLKLANDVTFFCLVEGMPLKSIITRDPPRTFYMFSYGGASLKRVDK